MPKPLKPPALSKPAKSANQSPTVLGEADVRDVFRVVLETLDMGFDPVEWRKCLLRGLREMTCSGMCIATLMPIDPTVHNGDVRPLFVAETFDARAVWQLEHFMSRIDMVRDPLTVPIMAQWTQPLTALLDQLMPRDQWAADEYARDTYLASDVFDFIHSRVPLPQMGLVSVLGMTRRECDGFYAERDRRVIELAHVQICARIAVPLQHATDPYSTLPTRLQELATHLRGPMSIKQIARVMRLSPFTVNNYTKSIYKRLNVSSRSEIVHVMKSRDGRSATRNELVLV